MLLVHWCLLPKLFQEYENAERTLNYLNGPTWLVFLVPSFAPTSASPEIRSSACSPCMSITVHITPILGQTHWLPADDRISWICMPPFQRCYLRFHSRLSLWSPAAVLSFLVTSLWNRHLPPATSFLQVQGGRWLCILSFGSSVRNSLPLQVGNAAITDTFSSALSRIFSTSNNLTGWILDWFAACLFFPCSVVVPCCRSCCCWSYCLWLFVVVLVCFWSFSGLFLYLVLLMLLSFFFV